MCDHVLLVEDDYTIADMLLDLLSMEGYEVTRVSTGAAALALLTADASDARSAPDVVLLDLQLPDMDGLEVLRSAESSSDRLPPVIVISAQPPNHLMEASKQPAVVATLRKPFRVIRLLNVIAEALDGDPEANHDTS